MYEKTEPCETNENPRLVNVVLLATSDSLKLKSKPAFKALYKLLLQGRCSKFVVYSFCTYDLEHPYWQVVRIVLVTSRLRFAERDAYRRKQSENADAQRRQIRNTCALWKVG